MTEGKSYTPLTMDVMVATLADGRRFVQLGDSVIPVRITDDGKADLLYDEEIRGSAARPIVAEIRAMRETEAS